MGGTDFRLITSCVVWSHTDPSKNIDLGEKKNKKV